MSSLPRISKTFLSITLFSPWSTLAQVTLSPPAPVATVQPNTWASLLGSAFYQQAAAIIAASGYDNATASAAQVAIDLEASNWAIGSVHTDPFYSLPPNASDARPGDIIKIQQSVNASIFTFPPQLALSRFIYQSTDFNGTAVPVPAYVLWPYAPRLYANCTGAPVVAWAHGTSGVNAECAPSHYQDLWYEYSAPFTLALNGYAVVATDFAGLGINQTADGKPIPHQWGANPAAAVDTLYALQAARTAWPTELGENFVLMGHSQGGGAAWAAAERLLREPMPGYLGTVAVSPAADFTGLFKLSYITAGPVAALIANTVPSVFPEFTWDQWLVPSARKAFQLYKDLSGCWAVRAELVQSLTAGYLYPNWTDGWVLNTFNELIRVGGRKFAGPMLVVQGSGDKTVNPNDTNRVVNATCSAEPQSDLEYVMFEGPDHLPTMYAGMSTWLDWIRERFEGKPTLGGCQRTDVMPMREAEAYQPQMNYYLELVTDAYERGL